MNKKIIGALCLAIACAGAAVYSNQKFNDNSPSNSLLLENVEALSQDDSGIYLPCFENKATNCNVNGHTANGKPVVITIVKHQRVQA